MSPLEGMTGISLASLPALDLVRRSQLQGGEAQPCQSAGSERGQNAHRALEG